MPAHRLDRLPAPLVALGAMLAAALLLLPGLGATDLWAPDEPRYAQVAEELRSLRHGAAGLVLLHLNDAVYNQKPPLYFWLAALAGAGPTAWARRRPSGCAGSGCCRARSARSCS